MGQTALPNFLMIGPPKCATTWLYFCLREHPDIYLPFAKELHFFDKFYANGIDWYRRYFLSHKGQKAIGEITPAYLVTPQVAGRIHHELPGVRLIICLRNPVNRAYSSYKRKFASGAYDFDFETALEKIPKLIEHGKYFSHLQEYLRFFKREDLLILIYEDLEKDETAFLKRIYEFLGVEPGFVPSVIGERRPPEDVSSPVYDFMAGISGFLRHKTKMGAVLDAVKKSKALPVVDKVLYKIGYLIRAKKNGKGRQALPMRPGTRETLVELFREENVRLAKLIGRDLGSWNE